MKHIWLIQTTFPGAIADWKCRICGFKIGSWKKPLQGVTVRFVYGLHGRYGKQEYYKYVTCEDYILRTVHTS